MKKHIKHTFKHVDPEKIKEKTEKNLATPKIEKIDLSDYTKSDLKNVVITMGIFLLVLIILYFLQRETEIFKKFSEIILK